MEVQFKIVDNRIDPRDIDYGTPGSAGIDLRRCGLDLDGEALVLKPGDIALIHTGIAMHLADNRYMGVIVPRSGQGHKRGLVLGNGTGIVDSDYTGEIMVSLWNRGDKTQEIFPMERIAQLLIVPVVQVMPKIVKEFTKTHRGAGGFGSTGI